MQRENEEEEKCGFCIEVTVCYIMCVLVAQVHASDSKSLPCVVSATSNEDLGLTGYAITETKVPLAHYCPHHTVCA